LNIVKGQTNGSSRVYQATSPTQPSTILTGSHGHVLINYAFRTKDFISLEVWHRQTNNKTQ